MMLSGFILSNTCSSHSVMYMAILWAGTWGTQLGGRISEYQDFQENQQQAKSVMVGFPPVQQAQTIAQHHALLRPHHMRRREPHLPIRSCSCRPRPDDATITARAPSVMTATTTPSADEYSYRRAQPGTAAGRRRTGSGRGPARGGGELTTMGCSGCVTGTTPQPK